MLSHKTKTSQAAVRFEEPGIFLENQLRSFLPLDHVCHLNIENSGIHTQF